MDNMHDMPSKGLMEMEEARTAPTDLLNNKTVSSRTADRRNPNIINRLSR